MIKELHRSIWERDFTLPIEYDCYEGESVTKEQIEALTLFISHPEWVDKAKKKVEIYCKKDVSADDTNQKKDNIFSYIKPNYYYVTRDEQPLVALLCKYRYDPEHGLAVIFSSGGSITVGMPDDYL